MDSNIIYDHQNVILGLAPVLTYAACEWFLIFLMLLDALLSYLLVWFARYCSLPLPCFLCSKLLHPLHWRLLLCRSHRSEVSSYISCLNHDNNLADCRGMCDDCLLSFTKTTGPDPDMNRLLLGKLGYDLLSTSHFAHPPRSCSCCDKPWRTRHHTQRLIRLGSRGAAKPNIPAAPRHHHLTRRGSGGSLKKMRNNLKAVDAGSRSDGMAHVGYAELKIHSESESEFLFTDDDAFFQTIDFSGETSERRVVHKSRSRESLKDKKVLKRKQPYLRDNIKPREGKLVDKTQHQPIEAREDEDVISELITMSEARPFSLDLPKEERAGGGVAQSENEAEVSGSSSPSGGEFLSPSGDNSTSNEVQIQSDFDQNISHSAVETEAAVDQKVCDHTDVPGSVADEPSSDEENVVEGDLTTNDMPVSLADEPSSDAENGVEGDLKPLTTNDEESNEVSENNVAEEYFSNEEEEEAEVNAPSEPSTSKDVTGSFALEQSHCSHEEENVDNGDSQPLTSNNMTGEHSSNEEEDVDNVTGSATEEHYGKEEHGETEPLTSPKNSNEGSSLEHSDDKDSSKVTETLNTSDETVPELKQSASVESFVSISSDIEGERLVDLLKQQLEQDRNSLKELSKELEEERNASAIAANQAMAMITRLQEEKAALHMEALQYLRMMDEQAEHDVDALERANDVLADREKEIQDLEMELEYYRVKYPDEPREEILASMGVLESIETSGNSTTDETSEKVPTDI
ncbi:probable myosin-binding protein 4 [Brassica rapa]|uniref:GTD-binding domain-containing protein n=1 Tax=Brassica campestris TaxID=3711 RepID=M4DYR1_BRACM|nr:probable myosin-binding protein 4 [Brassica rapa]